MPSSKLCYRISFFYVSGKNNCLTLVCESTQYLFIGLFYDGPDTQAVVAPLCTFWAQKSWALTYRYRRRRLPCLRSFTQCLYKSFGLGFLCLQTSAFCTWNHHLWRAIQTIFDPPSTPSTAYNKRLNLNNCFMLISAHYHEKLDFMGGCPL